MRFTEKHHPPLIKKIATVTNGKTSYSDTKVTTGTAYTYKVRAYKTVNGSQVYGDYSNEASATLL